MADYLTEVRLRQQIANLDAALARDDRIAASFATDQINQLTAAMNPRPTSDENRLVRNLPRWIHEIVKNKGVRVEALERALGADKVVISGRLGTRNMLELKINF